MKLHYRVVDVFTEVPLEGNALAVFYNAEGLEDGAMQRIAREMNLSETTFILPAQRPGCAARVRIFTPGKEMLFAGHPTIGTAWVLRERGIVPESAQHFALDEAVGAVEVRSDGDGLIWLRTPEIRRSRTYDPALCAAAVGLTAGDLLDGIAPQNVSAGNPAVFIALRDRATVDRAEVDTVALRRLLADEPEPTCLFVFTPAPQGAYSRMFANDFGIVEDPATGSATGPLAAYMMEHALVARSDGTRFISEQGVKMGRRSLLHVLIHGENGNGGIEVGGSVTPVADATLTI